MVGFDQCFTTRSEAKSGEALIKPNHRMHYLQRFTVAYSSIFSFYYDKIYMLQTKTSILYINTNHITPNWYVDSRSTRKQFRLIDNLDSGRLGNASDSSLLLTNEKAGVGGVAAESGRITYVSLVFPKTLYIFSHVMNFNAYYLQLSCFLIAFLPTNTF